MFERVEQAVERRNRPQILILYLNVYIYHHATRQRHEVPFDEPVRRQT